ncbi:DnaA regulatory inactivator Hda [Alteromonas sp. ASW11-130]|uniref:DnaA regulatory inactivator Hda n=1 Tax=Alteromonas sp. ASW11-130 TaxID=3015775 RepID=UPI002241C378|nr:DnaA regulatory inactivator Hda [Alteromonas sp. ASW11-130]MCW8092426.1 DnaA regulatory inactivator Hda [Alteromonas sp. ASW11-130]
MNSNKPAQAVQLPLPVSLPVDETFSSFVVGKNSQLVDLLSKLSNSPFEDRRTYLNANSGQNMPLVNIVGGKGRGKSHLLFSMCHELAQQQSSHIYLNLNDFNSLHPQLLDGLEQVGVICLDNLQAISGVREWEVSIFDLINRVNESQFTTLVCTSELGPSHPDFKLPDLRSRLGWGITFQVHALTEEERKKVIRLRAQQRGLKLSEAALDYLLNRSDRDLPSLLRVLDILDERSLQEKKRLTLNLVRQVIESEG